MHIEPFLAEAVWGFLLSWWKMLLMLPPFVAWAWLISSKLDKDARYFHLNYQMWNGIHLAAGILALAAMLAIPIFWLSWPAGVAILAAPILIYWRVRDAAVPEDQRFRLSGEGMSAKLAARRQARAAKAAVLQFTDAKRQQRKVPTKEEPLYPIHMLSEDVLAPALTGRASRLEMAVSPAGANIAQTVDGLKYKREPIPGENALKLLDYLKDIAGLDLADRRKRQSGEFRVKGPSGENALTLVTWGSSTGQALRIDFDREKRLHKPFDGLGLLAPQMEPLRLLLESHERHGIVLIGAPPGHGLSTTAYAFLSRHDAYTSNVKSLEREIVVRLDGVDQVQWDPSNPDIDYATNLQSILRRDPDIVLTGEILDSETARVASDPGMKGPLIYVQQPFPTISEQIRDWVKKVGDVKEAAKGLRVVTNQRLLRSLCPNCRQAYEPSPEQVKKLNLPAKKVTQLFRAGGKVQVKNKIEDCPVCGGSGYLGQTAAFEVMMVDDEVRKALSAGDLKAALAQARRNKMIYLQEAALAKVVAGETTIEEVVRVTAPAKTAGEGGAQSAAA
jgi:type II secretory ATPase GspE/PulE/Tfp pilus assembly ATPase PilB-like protein